MATNSKNTRNKVIVLVLVAVILLGGFSALFAGIASSSDAPEATPAQTATSSEPAESPATEEPTAPVSELPASPAAVGTVVSGPTALTEADLALATGATAPLVAVGGTYISLQGYELFDTLTVLRFESGEQAYFVSSGGFFPSSGGIPADQMSRDLTGFGVDLAPDSAEAVEAAQILENHRIEVG